MMQFNPLFLNDIKGNQPTNNNSGKLQKNQYLFSDIIKVVMEDNGPEESLTKLSTKDQTKEAEIIGGNFIQVSEQLQNISITDAESEEMKIQLADILPEDMAKLLTTDDIEINNDQIVSYIGKEQMQGDLQNFLTGLVGEKVFEKHVTDDSGVLLKLEDAKSSVNIEITKEINNSSTENKTMVHALIVPQKSKLQLLTTQNNLLNELKNNGYLHNIINSEKLEKLENEINNSSIIKTITAAEENNIKNTKPTLSVFSFNINNDVESTSSLSEKLKALVKKNENELEKIIKSTKNIKHNVNTKTSVNEVLPEEAEDTGKISSKVINEKGNLFEAKEIKNESSSIKHQKDFNISKITIIKKQNSESVQETSKNNNTISKEVNGNKNLSENIQATENHLESKQKENTTEISQTNSTQKQTVKNNITSLKSRSDVNLDNIPKSTTNLTSDISKEPELKTETQIKEEFNNTISNESNKNKNFKQSVVNDITENKVKINENGKNIVELSQNKVSEESTKENGNVTKNNIDTQLEKRDIKVTRKEHNDISSENKNSSVANQITVEKATKNLMPNKKVSVKVKKVVKSVNNKSEQENNISNKIRLEQQENQHENNSDLNYSKESQNIKNPDLETHTKKKLDSTFHHIIQKEQGIKLNDANATPQEVRQQNSERIVKSIEVIKEISRFISKKEKGSLSFTIKPEHLGQLKITLETHDHVLNAHIQVENEQAKQLVEKNLNDLHSQLKDNGVELNSLNVSLGYSSKHKESSGEKNKSNLGYSAPIQEEITQEEKASKSLGYNTYEYLA